MSDRLIRKTLPAKRSIAVVGVALAALLGATGMTPTAAAVAVPQTSNAAKAAAGWLAREFTDKQRIELFFEGLPGDFPDETAWAVLDFDAAGVAQEYARNATAWLAQPAVLRSFLDGHQAESSVTAHALIILVAEAQAKNPRNFGGVNVLAELRAMRNSAGQFVSSPPEDNQTVFDQSMAILALDRVGGAPRDAVNLLAQSQCPDGGFPGSFDFNPPPPPVGVCGSDLVSTPWVIQALLAAGNHRAAVNRALDWLEAQARPTDGSFHLPGDTASITGPAAVALTEGGRHAAANRAIAVLKSLQANCTNEAVNRGAIGEDSAGGATSGTDLSADGTIEATLATIPALARTTVADVNAAGARQQDPQLSCPTTS